MKPTRLQLLLLLVALGAAGYFGYVWWEGHTQALASAPVESTPPPPPSTFGSLLPPAPVHHSATSTVPKVSKVVTPSPPPPASNDGSYTVVKGDTLWRIASVDSPVHQGPGWVTIWKANKDTVKNFDRLEVGWNLTIPADVQEYVMPYWKPRALAQARQAATSTVVDLRQLPTGAESVLVDLKQLPPAMDSVLVDLRQLPTGEEFALAEAPKDLRVALDQLPPAPEMALVELIPTDFTASAFPRPVERYVGQPQFPH